MAMIDYGAILKKNGKIVNRNQFFMDMETAVGWTDNPRIKYEDCDCFYDGESDCMHCPRANRKVWDDGFIILNYDCRGNEPPRNTIRGNWFAYAGDTEFVVGFYKQCVLLWTPEREEVIWLNWGQGCKISHHFNINGIKLHFRAVTECRNVYYGRFHYKGDLYEVVFGYGIDPNQATWNRVKKEYCDKKTVKFVDNFWIESKN